MTEKQIDPKKLTQELQAEGLPVAGVASTGRLDFTRELTKAEKSKVDLILSIHDPAPSFDEVRLEMLRNAGISTDLIVLALWDQVIKDDSSLATVLNNRMNEINTSI